MNDFSILKSPVDLHEEPLPGRGSGSEGVRQEPSQPPCARAWRGRSTCGNHSTSRLPDPAAAAEPRQGPGTATDFQAADTCLSSLPSGCPETLQLALAEAGKFPEKKASAGLESNLQVSLAYQLSVLSPRERPANSLRPATGCPGRRDAQTGHCQGWLKAGFPGHQGSRPPADWEPVGWACTLWSGTRVRSGTRAVCPAQGGPLSSPRANPPPGHSLN